jgi:hypothetical protein
MICNLIRQIPLVIPILAFVNVVILKIAALKANFPLKEPLSRLARLQFNAKMPVYFNYWIIYIAIAIVISIIFLFTKKYTLCKTGAVVTLNVLVGVMVMYRIISKM